MRGDPAHPDADAIANDGKDERGEHHSQVSISVGIFKGFMVRTTARAAARAEDVYRGKLVKVT